MFTLSDQNQQIIVAIIVVAVVFGSIMIKILIRKLSTESVNTIDPEELARKLEKIDEIVRATIPQEWKIHTTGSFVWHIETHAGVITLVCNSNMWSYNVNHEYGLDGIHRMYMEKCISKVNKVFFNEILENAKKNLYDLINCEETFHDEIGTVKDMLAEMEKMLTKEVLEDADVDRFNIMSGKASNIIDAIINRRV